MKETAGDSSSGSPADGSKVAAVADSVPLCMRPVSSLSLHSTCSECTPHPFIHLLLYDSRQGCKDTNPRPERTKEGPPHERHHYSILIACFPAPRVPLIRPPIPSELSDELGVECSSSSGRMSTVSGCSGISLGDSGTHSDPEDRKQMITLPYDGARLGKGIANYEIPPAPRPIITQQARRFSPPRYTLAPVKLTAATVPCTCIEERPPQPVPRPDIPETEFDDGNCYISVGGICGPSQEELTARVPTKTQDGISETNPTNTEYLTLELETGSGVKTPCVSPKCSALRDYMNVNKSDQGTDGGRPAGSEGSKTAVDDVTPASPCPSDTSDLPDYINVTIPAVTSAPPIPVRPSFLLYTYGALCNLRSPEQICFSTPGGLTALRLGIDRTTNDGGELGLGLALTGRLGFRKPVG
uniref:Uncharacterized protein n=1 Tax=Timema poppense TaxID=170557 RepID=A0A7R9DBQ3_TIMPO|nr:unnamed protein product [Timema poppensis]